MVGIILTNTDNEMKENFLGRLFKGGRGRPGVSINPVIIVLLFCSAILLLQQQSYYNTNNNSNSRPRGLAQQNTNQHPNGLAQLKNYDEVPFINLQTIEKAYLAMFESRNIPKYPCRICLIQPMDKCLLYQLGKAASGAVLEEGSFCGCSTTAIALGMRDRANNNSTGTNKKPFPMITSDAFPVSPNASQTPNQYRIEVNDEGKKVRRLYVWEKVVFELAADEENDEFFRMYMEPLLQKDGSVLPCLFQTLHNNNLHNQVTIVAGHSKTAPPLQYKFIFSDAVHSMSEAIANEPTWEPYLTAGYPIIIAFDDVAKLPNVQEYLINKYKPDYTMQTKKIWVMQVNGNK